MKDNPSPDLPLRYAAVGGTIKLKPSHVCDMVLALIDEHSDALFVKDNDGRYLLLNRAAARLVGKAREEVLGQDDTALFDPEGAHRIMAQDREILKTGEVRTDEESLTAGGVTRVYLATKAPYHDAEGTLRGVLGYSRDVTAHKQADAALRQSENILRKVLNALPLGVQVMDTEGNIFLSNPACEKIWGRIIGSGEQRYAAVQAWWHDTKRPLKKDDWGSVRALTRGEVSHNEMVDIQSFDGELRTILNSAVPVYDHDNSIMGAVIINEDITDRLRLEAQFLQAQKMEAVGHLAGGVAHDFNNLLTVISGYSELLTKNLERDEVNRDLVAEIHQAAVRAQSLTQQLLAFSRQSVLQPKVMRLNELIQGTEKMLRRLITEDILLHVELEEDTGFVRIDPVQFDQVLMNFAVNARDAMPAGGKLTISSTSRSCPEGFVAVTVTDTGVGMSPDVLTHIFEPFFTTKPPGQGTGLGLSTVYGIVQQSGGTIEVQSTPGVGTVFRLLLPTEEGHGPTEAMTPAGVDSTGTETILLVEDEAPVRALIKRALQRSGYTVHEASNGLEALRWVSENDHFDLLVTDVVMPEMGGRALADKLRECRPALKVLFISGYSNDTVGPGSRRVGDGYLPKPFSLDVLTQRIRQLLDARA